MKRVYLCIFTLVYQFHQVHSPLIIKMTFLEGVNYKDRTFRPNRDFPIDLRVITFVIVFYFIIANYVGRNLSLKYISDLISGLFKCCEVRKGTSWQR